MAKISTILLIAALLLIPVSALIEKNHPQVWNSRLFQPSFKSEPNRHTPTHPLGTFLPPAITQDTSFTASDNPIILPASTTIAKNATLTFAPGTQIFAHEHARLAVAGTLIAQGTRSRPILFTSNEQHPQNRTWSGIAITGTGTANITHTNFSYGAPAITCLPGSTAAISNASFELGNLALYTESQDCAITNSHIDNVRDGIIAVGVQPQVSDTKIDARHQEIQTIIPTPS